MNFGMFLVRQGRLTTNQFFELLEQQIASRPQVGTLAIETGRLTVKQVFQVLRAQCEVPAEHFGETAVRLGLLSEDGLAALIYEQLRRATTMTDLLVINGHADQETAEQWLGEYRASQGRVTQMTSESAPAKPKAQGQRSPGAQRRKLARKKAARRTAAGKS